MIQMPALNTPQFGWVKSRLPRKAQPVPPIYQPELAAEAIVYASHDPRRETYVGLPTIKAIIGNKLFPGLPDHYLGRTGYVSGILTYVVYGDQKTSLVAQPAPQIKTIAPKMVTRA